MDRLFGTLYMAEKYDSLLGPHQQQGEPGAPQHPLCQENLVPVRQLKANYILVYLPAPTTVFIAPATPIVGQTARMNVDHPVLDTVGGKDHPSSVNSGEAGSSVVDELTKDTAAGKFLMSSGVSPAAFANLGNSSGSEPLFHAYGSGQAPFGPPLQGLSVLRSTAFSTLITEGIEDNGLDGKTRTAAAAKGCSSLEAVRQKKNSSSNRSPNECGGRERDVIKKFCELYVRRCSALLESECDFGGSTSGAPAGMACFPDANDAEQHMASSTGTPGRHTGNLRGQREQRSALANRRSADPGNVTASSCGSMNSSHLGLSPRSHHGDPHPNACLTDVTLSGRSARTNVGLQDAKRLYATIAVLEVPLEKLKPLSQAVGATLQGATVKQDINGGARSQGLAAATICREGAASASVASCVGSSCAWSAGEHERIAHGDSQAVVVSAPTKEVVGGTQAAEVPSAGLHPIVSESPFFEGWFTIECSTTYRRLLQLLRVTEWPAVALVDSNGTVVTTQALAHIQREICEYEAALAEAAEPTADELLEGMKSPINDLLQTKVGIPLGDTLHNSSSQTCQAGSATGASRIPTGVLHSAMKVGSSWEGAGSDLEALRRSSPSAIVKSLSGLAIPLGSPGLPMVRTSRNCTPASKAAATVFRTGFPWRGCHPVFEPGRHRRCHRACLAVATRARGAVCPVPSSTECPTATCNSTEGRARASSGDSSVRRCDEDSSNDTDAIPYTSPLELLASALQVASSDSPGPVSNHSLLEAYCTVPLAGSTSQRERSVPPETPPTPSGLLRGCRPSSSTDLAQCETSPTSFASGYTHFALYFGNSWYPGCKTFSQLLLRLWQNVNMAGGRGGEGEGDSGDEQSGELTARRRFEDFSAAPYPTLIGSGTLHGVADDWDGSKLGGDSLTYPLGNSGFTSEVLSATAGGDPWKGLPAERKKLRQRPEDSGRRKSSALSLHVVYASSDRDESRFLEECQRLPSEWQFLSPFKPHSRKIIKSLMAQYDVRALPSLLIFKTGSGRLVQRYGEVELRADPRGAHFPWVPAGSALGTVTGCVNVEAAEDRCFASEGGNSKPTAPHSSENVREDGRGGEGQHCSEDHGGLGSEEMRCNLVVPFFTNPLPVNYREIHVFSAHSLETQSALRLGGSYVVLIGNGCRSRRLMRACILALREVCFRTFDLIESFKHQAQHTLWGVKPILSVHNFSHNSHFGPTLELDGSSSVVRHKRCGDAGLDAMSRDVVLTDAKDSITDENDEVHAESAGSEGFLKTAVNASLVPSGGAVEVGSRVKFPPLALPGVGTSRHDGAGGSGLGVFAPGGAGNLDDGGSDAAAPTGGEPAAQGECESPTAPNLPAVLPQSEEGTARTGRFPLPSVHFLNALDAGHLRRETDDTEDTEASEGPHSPSDSDDRSGDEGAIPAEASQGGNGERATRADAAFLQQMLRVAHCDPETQWLLQEHVFSVIANQDEKLLPPLSGEPYVVWLSLPQRKAAVLRRMYECERPRALASPDTSRTQKEKASVLYQPAPTAIGTTTMTGSLAPPPANGGAIAMQRASGDSVVDSRNPDGEHAPFDVAQEQGSQTDHAASAALFPTKGPILPESCLLGASGTASRIPAGSSTHDCPAANPTVLYEFVFLHLISQMEHSATS